MKQQKNPIAQKRRTYLRKNTGIDRILKTIDVVRDYTEFVTSQGGDIVVYRVYGRSEDEFEIYIK